MRNIPLLPRARKILARSPMLLKSPRARKEPAQFSAQLQRRQRAAKSPYVLLNPETGLRYDGMNKGLRGACKRAGIPILTWHDLRRTCGCRLLQDRGMSIEEVSKWLGHSSIDVTQRAYAFLEDEQLHEAAARVKRRHKSRHTASG
jgi:integrase/recombinase XerD